MTQKLKLSDLISPLPFNTHRVNLWWNIGDLLQKQAQIDYDVFLPSIGMNLQRPFCWSLSQKQQLILSMVKGIFIPKLCVLVDQQNEEYKYQIIDGKQRLSAMIGFLSGEFNLPTGHYFADCDQMLQSRIKTYSPVCEAEYYTDSKPISDAAKIAWFEQINFSGTLQDEEHLIRLKSGNKFKK